MDIVTACDVLEVKRERGEVFCLLKKSFKCTIVHTEESKRSKSKVREEMKSQKYCIETKRLCKLGIFFSRDFSNKLAQGQINSIINQ